MQQTCSTGYSLFISLGRRRATAAAFGCVCGACFTRCGVQRPSLQEDAFCHSVVSLEPSISLASLGFTLHQPSHHPLRVVEDPVGYGPRAAARGV